MEDNTDARIGRIQEVLKSLSHLLVLVGLYFTFFIVFGAIGVIAGQLLSGADLFTDVEQIIKHLSDSNKVYGYKIIQLFGSFGAFVVSAFVFVKVFVKEKPATYFGFTHVFPPVGQFLLVLIIAVSAMPVISYISSLNQLIDLPADIKKEADAMQNNYNIQALAFLKADTISVLLFNLLVIAIVPALGEELLFRGAFMQTFYRLFNGGIHWPIIITAILFSVLHLEFYNFIPIMLMGVMFGYMYYWSGNIMVSIWAHFINNAIVVVSSYLQPMYPENKYLSYNYTPSPLVTIVSAVVFAAAIFLFYRATKKFHPVAEVDETTHHDN